MIAHDTVLNWHKTTTGHVLEINGARKWFVRAAGAIWEVYEIVQGDCGCLLRTTAQSLNNAKLKAYQRAINVGA